MFKKELLQLNLQILQIIEKHKDNLQQLIKDLKQFIESFPSIEEKFFITIYIRDLLNDYLFQNNYSTIFNLDKIIKQLNNEL